MYINNKYINIFLIIINNLLTTFFFRSIFHKSWPRLDYINDIIYLYLYITFYVKIVLTQVFFLFNKNNSLKSKI